MMAEINVVIGCRRGFETVSRNGPQPGARGPLYPLPFDPELEWQIVGQALGYLEVRWLDALGEADSEHHRKRQYRNQEVKQQPENQALPFSLQIDEH
jgi:hypothetical protein